jgi:CRP-like cAMP-binding protein
MAEIPENEWAYFQSHLDYQVYDKGELLIRAGEYLKKIYFILDGIVRFFYLTVEGKDFTKHFALENDFVGSFSSLVLKETCRFSVEAQTKTEVLALPIEIIKEGYMRHPSWERIGRIHAERIAVKKELRECEFLLDSAEVRYRRFLNEYIDVVDRIPQYHIASYLGITDVSLSRIRKKIGLTWVNGYNFTPL